MARLLIASLLLISLIAACSASAYVRVLHGSPDTPNVDVYVDGAKALTNIPFKTYTMDYIALTAGAHNIKVWPTGAGSGTGTPAINADVTLTDGTFYLVAAIGLLSGTGPTALRAAVYTDQGGKAGVAKVRVIHMSPDAPTVIVTLAGNASAVLVPGITFPDATAAYLEVPPASYSFDVRPQASPTTVALNIPSTALAANTAYTAIAVGRLTGTPALSALLLVDGVMPTAAPTTAPPAGSGASAMSAAAAVVTLATAVVLAL